jgi:glycosyl transferase family 4/glycosyl transferase family 1
MVQYYFPPLGGIGSVRAAGFAGGLSAFGWHATVVAPRDGSYHADPSLSPGDAEVVRSFAPDLSRGGKRVLYGTASTTRAADVGAAGRWLRDRVRAFLYRPDGQVAWYPFARSAARALLRDRKFDAVFSSSFPITSHLIARRIAREAGLPWVAEFRDPWSAAKSPDDPARGYASRVEASLLADADAVVSVSPTWARQWRAQGARRAQVITNGYDPRPAMPPGPDGDFVVTHVGTFYPAMEDLGALWPALRRVADHSGAARLRIRIVGDCHPLLAQAARAAGLESRLEVTGFVARERALDLMTASSVLVVGGAPRPHPVLDGWIPAKMFEYLGTGRPMLYIGHRASDAARIAAEQPGCWVVPASDIDATHEALEAIRGGASFYARDLAPFTRRALTHDLSALLDEVSAG